ncbi:hypothetical protein [Paludibacterium denitrificans]|nr:hypothetical protein [Paludibacterium denitrificans]
MDPKRLDTQPESMARWLDALPYSNLEECGRQLLDGLRLLGHTPMDASARHKLLKLYLGALDRYFPALETEILQDDVASSARSRQLAMVAVALFASVFSTFKQTLAERLSKRSLLDREQPKIELLLYSMMSARQLANLSMRCYCPLPQGFWHDCHQLFRPAVERGWHERQLDNDDSLRVIYQQILLLGITSTNSLSQQEMTVARQLIMDWAVHAQLQPVETLDTTRLGYLVDTSRDEPPRFLPINASQLGAGCYWFNLEGALALVKRRIEQLLTAQNSNAAAQLYDELALLRGLAEEWQQPKRLRHQRMSMREVLELTATVPNIWYLANGHSWITAAEGNNKEEGDEPPPAPVALRTPPPPSLFLVVNQSAQGLRLRGQPRGQLLRAGEVILLSPPGKPAASQLCLIRWVSLLPDGMEVECGVEVIGKLPEPVRILPTITHPEDQYQYALCLQAISPLHRPPMLLTQGRQFSRLRELRLQDRNGEILIRCTRLDTQTPHVQLMEYRDSDNF